MSMRTARAAAVATDGMLAKANVVGVADGGDRVLVLVERKVPADRLAPGDLVERVTSGVRTDVIEVGQVEALLAPGTSIGLAGAGTGTFGTVVRDAGGVRYGLTNNHVAADSNRALVTDLVYSPGEADGRGGRFGRLGRFEPIWFDRENLVDAALVLLDDQSTPARHPRLTLSGRVGWRVSKTGRTSGTTSGRIIGVGATIDVGFGSQGSARFVGQVLTEPMLRPGDSGSVLTTFGGFVCGLGFAGSDTVSVANPIGAVLEALAVRMP